MKVPVSSGLSRDPVFSPPMAVLPFYYASEANQCIPPEYLKCSYNSVFNIFQRGPLSLLVVFISNNHVHSTYI